MASNTLSNVRLQLRYDTYINWMSKDPILLAGEVAVAEMTGRRTLTNSDDTPNFTPPAIGVKIGNGHDYFSELPWIQAVAADVYKWAKKPRFQDIEGLETYVTDIAQTVVENSGSGGGSSGGGSGSSSGAYRIIYDGVNNKYILQQYNEELEQWENTSSEINFTPVLNRIATIENWANGAYTDIGNISVPMIAYIQEVVTTFIGQLDVSDSPVEHQFVTSVSETNGKISVSRSTIKANDITEGTLPVARGGTGVSAIEYNEVLVGGARGEFVKKQITSTIDPNETGEIPTTGALVNYVTNATAGLTGAMHFVGEASVPIGENNSRTDPQIDGYDFRKVQAGDVILANDKQEYVWTGSVWRLLGDEGSYAVKGSITDSDIDEEANIAQSKIYNLTETLNSKVDKEENKGLSSNDFDNEFRDKLRDIEAGAQVNTIEGITLNGTTQTPDLNKIVNLSVSEFDTASQLKLAGIETGAQVNTISGITLNGTPQTPDSNTKIVALTVKEFTDEDKRKLNTIEEGAQVNAIETIYLNDKIVSPDQNKRLDLHIREYPQEDENKLKAIESGAQVNVIEHIKIDNQEITVDSNKTISITTNPHTEHENVIESISFNGTVVQPDNNKQVTLVQNDHPEHENVIEEIQINGTTQTVTNKTVNLLLNESTLDVGQITGAQIPGSNNTKDDVTVIAKKLQLSRIAASGNVQDLIQTQNTFMILDCGTSNSDIHE